MWDVGNGEVAECLGGTQNALPVDSYMGDGLQFQIGFAHCAFSARLFLVLFWQHVLTLAGACQHFGTGLLRKRLCVAGSFQSFSV